MPIRYKIWAPGQKFFVFSLKTGREHKEEAGNHKHPERNAPPQNPEDHLFTGNSRKHDRNARRKLHSGHPHPGRRCDRNTDGKPFTPPSQDKRIPFGRKEDKGRISPCMRKIHRDGFSGRKGAEKEKPHEKMPPLDIQGAYGTLRNPFGRRIHTGSAGNIHYGRKERDRKRSTVKKRKAQVQEKLAQNRKKA